jgi:hypothetical protein
VDRIRPITFLVHAMNATVQAKQSLRNSRNGPRIDARKSKLRALTPEQTAALKQWLFLEKITYKAAIARMAQFGVKLSLSQMNAFWNQNCEAMPQSEGAPAMLDLVIRSSAPVRLVVNQNGQGVTVTITPQT